MRNEPLPAPFENWTIDGNGTIHTECGYRCTPRIIEGALWLMGIATISARTQIMWADTGPNRPAYEIADITDDDCRHTELDDRGRPVERNSACYQRTTAARPYRQRKPRRPSDKRQVAPA